MRKYLMFGGIGVMALAGVGIGAVMANTSGLDTWKSGKNHNRVIQVQNEGGVQADSGKVGIAFFSNSSFRITSPRGITIMVDPWRNDPSGAWGLWYRMEFPAAEVDVGMSTHAHFDHDALGRLEANSTLMPATEWAQTHEHTMLDTASVEISTADLEGKSGHVYYFGSHNMATEMAKEG